MEEEEDESIGAIGKYFLNKPNTDKTFGVRKIDGHHYIGNKHVIIKEDDDIIIKEDGDRFMGTRGLWELITLKNLDETVYDKMDLKDYERLMIKTNALHHDYDPKNPYPRSSKADKWKYLLSPIWNKYKALSSKEREKKKNLCHGIGKSLMERVLLSCRVILMHC